MKFSIKICVLYWISSHTASVQGKSLLEALSAYPQLSNFTSLLKSNPTVASSFLSASALSPQTVLVPEDNAFLSFQKSTGQSFFDASRNYQIPTIQYHILNGNYSTQDFQRQEGITIPTALTDELYNNRTGGDEMRSSSAKTGNTDGQVVFIAPDSASTTLQVRQVASPGAYAQSGLGNQVNLTSVSGVWDGGSFYTVNGFLTLPEVCTKTIRARGLTSLDASLNRTGLGTVLDHFKNVTCLGPSDKAFRDAGNPDSKANVSALTSALAFHTIPMPLYSNFLKDGQTFKTLSNQTVRITIKSGAIYFNDAKVTQMNVLTNNGLIHVLDRVMSPLNSDGTTATGTATGATPSKTGPSSGASRAVVSNPLTRIALKAMGFVYACVFLFL